MKARLAFHEKRLVWSSLLDSAGIVELKVWEIPRSEQYPAGRKFSLFLVAQGEVLIGIDNHHPKEPICTWAKKSDRSSRQTTTSS